jgi:hypothetical protein
MEKFLVIYARNAEDVLKDPSYEEGDYFESRQRPNIFTE